MGQPEERTRGLIELRGQIADRIDSCRADLEFLERARDAVDQTLKQSSFSRASSLRGGGEPAEAPPEGGAGAGGPGPAPAEGGSELTAGGSAVATARRGDGAVEIEVAPGARLDAGTPPFRSFFMDRIIAGMRGRGVECSVREEGGLIRSISVRNCGPADADEVVRTAEWSFRKMLEKSGG